ncbi:MAG: hypothetical protein RM347_034590 [Nostoc sp. ChiQUE02]|nr:hypothetical protein [Nostoc sp. ChiQUE02]MDZ8229761.1 hypothetical protein [Nostoc sp. ChiQUE02]
MVFSKKRSLPQSDRTCHFIAFQWQIQIIFSRTRLLKSSYGYKFI